MWTVWIQSRYREILTSGAHSAARRNIHYQDHVEYGCFFLSFCHCNSCRRDLIFDLPYYRDEDKNESIEWTFLDTGVCRVRWIHRWAGIELFGVVKKQFQGVWHCGILGIRRKDEMLALFTMCINHSCVLEVSMRTRTRAWDALCEIESRKKKQRVDRCYSTRECEVSKQKGVNREIRRRI